MKTEIAKTLRLAAEELDKPDISSTTLIEIARHLRTSADLLIIKAQEREKLLAGLI